jgi:hypothetical protein
MLDDSVPCPTPALARVRVLCYLSSKNESEVTMHNDDVPEALQHEMRAIIAKHLGQYGIKKTEIRAGEDHAGDPAIFVDVWYKLTTELYDPKYSIAATSELNRQLGAAREYRFVYFRNHFPDDQPVITMKRPVPSDV